MPNYNHVHSSPYATTTMSSSHNDTMQAQPVQGQIQFRAPSYSFQHAAQNTQHDNPNVQVANLAQSFGGMNLQGFQSLNPGRPTNSSVAGHAHGTPQYVGAQTSDPIYVLPDGRLMVAGMPPAPQPSFQPPGPAFKPAAPHFVPQITLQTYMSGQSVHPGVPQHQSWAPQPVAKVPDLAEPRRTSLSSNEENAPRTPYLGAVQNIDVQPGIAISDRSLSNGYTYSAPSMLPMAQPYLPLQISKGSDGNYTYLDLDALTQQEPPIPRAVPAPWSSNSQRTLDKCNCHQNLC